MKRMIVPTVLASLLAAASAFAAGSDAEKTVFETLAAHGAAVAPYYTFPPQVPGAGAFQIQTLTCSLWKNSQPADYTCEFTDQARPQDPKGFDGADAKALYETLVATGVVPTEAPFTHGLIMNAKVETLKCFKHGYEGSPIQYSCTRTKPLVEAPAQ